MEENVCVVGGSRENMTLEVGRERRRGGRERFCRAGRLARLPLELLGSLLTMLYSNTDVVLFNSLHIFFMHLSRAC